MTDGLLLRFKTFGYITMYGYLIRILFEFEPANNSQVSSPQVRLGLEVWTLHENPTPNNVLGAGRCHNIFMLHSDHSLEFGLG